MTERMAEHYSHVPLAEKAAAVGTVLRLVRRLNSSQVASSAEVEVSVEVEAPKSESGA